MVVTLLVITLVSASAVGFVYKITAEPIARAKAAKITAAIALVLPTFDNDPGAAKTVQTVDGKEVVVYTATQGQDTVGYAVETFTNTGFGGEIKLMVGFLKDGHFLACHLTEDAHGQAGTGEGLTHNYAAKIRQTSNWRCARTAGTSTPSPLRRSLRAPSATP